MSTINIIIKGIAICYQKVIDGKNVWRILFPFNECHTVKFSYNKGAGEVFVGHLGKAKSRVEVALQPEAGPASSTQEFDEKVLDLTSGDASLETHSSIASKEKWEERGILLTIPSAVFDVRKTLLDFSINQGLNIFLYNSKNGAIQILHNSNGSGQTRDIAHSITGRIVLEKKGALSVKTDTNTVFTAEPDTDYTLTFDNDCNELPKGRFKNDMEMIYELLEEPEQADRKFLVKAEGGTAEPPDLLKGKPCLVVKISDAKSIESLP